MSPVAARAPERKTVQDAVQDAVQEPAQERELVVSPAVLQEARAAVERQFQELLERFLPQAGPLQRWTISEWEQALLPAMLELARKLTAARLEVDPQRAPARNRCPQCGRALMGHGLEPAHRQTLFGPLDFERAYGYCRSCGSAFSPSGHRVGLRRGLL